MEEPCNVGPALVGVGLGPGSAAMLVVWDDASVVETGAGSSCVSGESWAGSPASAESGDTDWGCSSPKMPAGTDAGVKSSEPVRLLRIEAVEAMIVVISENDVNAELGSAEIVVVWIALVVMHVVSRVERVQVVMHSVLGGRKVEETHGSSTKPPVIDSGSVDPASY